MIKLLDRMTVLSSMFGKYDFTEEEKENLVFCISFIDKIREKKKKQNQNKKDRTSSVTVEETKSEVPITCFVKSLKAGRTRIKIDKNYIILEVYEIPIVVIRCDGRLFTLQGLDNNITFRRHAEAFMGTNQHLIKFPRQRLDRAKMMGFQLCDGVVGTKMYPKKEDREDFYVCRFL